MLKGDGSTGLYAEILRRGGKYGVFKKEGGGGALPPGHSVYVSRVTVVSIIRCD